MKLIPTNNKNLYEIFIIFESKSGCSIYETLTFQATEDINKLIESLLKPVRMGDPNREKIYKEKTDALKSLNITEQVGILPEEMGVEYTFGIRKILYYDKDGKQYEVERDGMDS